MAGEQAKVQICPYCQNTNGKFFVNISGGDTDGLHDCKVCSATGNFWKLREVSGFSTGGVTSMKDAGVGKPSPLPNMDNLHKQLMESDKFSDVLDYLIAERGFSSETIIANKLGALERDGRNFVIYPYFDDAGNPIFFKGRSISGPKTFIAPSNRPTPLYNSSCLKEGVEEVIMVEGEADTLALLNVGITNVVGAPGAGIKKAEWIERLDQVGPKRVYIIYDNDKAGLSGALELARRVGLEKCYNVKLPAFELEGGKPGKDLNEWFKTGKTAADFEELKKTGKLFDVDGVGGLLDTLEELKSEVEETGSGNGKYPMPWASLTQRCGNLDDGDMVGVIAEGKIGKTTFCMNCLDFYSKLGFTSLNFCLEMKPKRLVRKWVSMATSTPDGTNDSKITPDVIQSAIEIAKSRPGDTLFGYTKQHKIDDIMNTIRQAVRRYGVKFVVFDNLQLLARSVEHQSSELSKYSKMFKELCMELGIVMFLIIQPHRVPEGQIVSARNAMGTASIEKDVDAMLCLHRNRVMSVKKEGDFQGYMETETTFEPQLLVKVDLCRYANGGITTLWFDGATSQVREMSANDMITPAPAGHQSIPVETVSV